MATTARVSVGWNPQLLQPPTWYFWNNARWADGNTVVTCCIVQSPEVLGRTLVIRVVVEVAVILMTRHEAFMVLRRVAVIHRVAPTETSHEVVY